MYSGPYTVSQQGCKYSSSLLLPTCLTHCSPWKLLNRSVANSPRQIQEYSRALFQHQGRRARKTVMFQNVKLKHCIWSTKRLPAELSKTLKSVPLCDSPLSLCPSFSASSQRLQFETIFLLEQFFTSSSSSRDSVSSSSSTCHI